MDDAQGGGSGGGATEDLILRTVAAHADSLLRTARRYSLCPDDAQDAYQRALEIFMGHAERLDPARAAGWLHVVVKREAQAIRKSRQKLVASDEIDMDLHEARSVPTPEEQLATFDLIGRSAEALQRLKPQELRALWLRAQGHSYNDIGALTGWSYTKVNRCLTEGRRSFLSRYADIESGAECERWLPVISAMIDGEASAAQVVELRPHLRNCPGCRATLKALGESSEPLAAVLPVPLIAVATDATDHVSNALTRIYEMVVGGFHERAVTSMMKIQTVTEATMAGKAAAIAGAAAAVAGGGYATVERAKLNERPVKPSAMSRPQQRPVKSAPAVVARQPVAQVATPARGQVRRRTPTVTEFAPRRTSTRAPEFARSQTQARTASVGMTRTTAGKTRANAPGSGATAPEFSADRSAPEFGP